MTRVADGMSVFGPVIATTSACSLRRRPRQLAHVIERLARRHEDKRREIMFDEGDRAVHEVRRGKAFGDHVAGFHELEGELKRIAVVDAAPHHHAMIHVAVTLHQFAQFGNELERFLDAVGDLADALHADAGAQRARRADRKS